MKLLKSIHTTATLQLAWLSKEAKETWAQPIHEIAKMVEDLEIQSVIADQRSCAWKSIDTAEVPKFTEKIARQNGLICYPIKRTGKWEGFSHRTIEVQTGKPTNTYCVITKDLKKALEFQDAFGRGDHKAQAKLLGFPDCCADFFNKHWAAGIVDPIYQMAENMPDTMATPTGENFLYLKEEPNPFSNPLLRYIGIRAGFHIPCSFKCQGTIRSGAERFELGDPELVKLAQALLSMPMSWDNYHGAAVIRTPIFQIVYQSNPTAEKYYVEIPGNFIPREAVKGNEYPNNQVK